MIPSLLKINETKKEEKVNVLKLNVSFCSCKLVSVICYTSSIWIQRTQLEIFGKSEPLFWNWLSN